MSHLEQAPNLQRTVLVTGGCGFIGSALIRFILATTGCRVINADMLTYAANPLTVEGFIGMPRYVHEIIDICDADDVKRVIGQYRPDGIIHLAAESHVDRSIEDPFAFVRTNVVGTTVLLRHATSYWRTLGGPERDQFRFHHVSTDEVYGSLGGDGVFTEQTPYAPNSPYAASKAASDHFVRAWHRTHGLPVVTSNCCNNFGPYQFPEKLIPLIIIKALAGKRLPVYGKGENIRDWLYVEDHAAALWTIFNGGAIGECYNVGADNERRNIDVVHAICALLDEFVPDGEGGRHERLIQFVADRPGHDYRYAVSSDKLHKDLGWYPQMEFDAGLRKTVSWYLENRRWWQAILDGSYAGERLGLVRET